MHQKKVGKNPKTPCWIKTNDGITYHILRKNIEGEYVALCNTSIDRLSTKINDKRTIFLEMSYKGVDRCKRCLEIYERNAQPNFIQPIISDGENVYGNGVIVSLENNNESNPESNNIQNE